MHDFCVTALAYMTRCPRELFANEPTYLLVDRLMGALHAKPWLLVLDGLGRVPVAYHRSDAAQIPDAEVEPGDGQFLHSAGRGTSGNCAPPRRRKSSRPPG